jgi:hypothetical protein
MQLQTIKYTKSSGSAFVDVVVVIATIALAASVILPRLARPRARGHPITCVNNLKQIGLSMRMWSNEHEDKFPWRVPEKDGGTLEHATSEDVFRHFLAITNELNSPKVLVCPHDKKRTRVGTFAGFSNNNVSYFVGLDADETKPNTILSGDRSISTNGILSKGLLVLSNAAGVTWAKGIHTNSGHIGFGDGSAQQISTADLKKVLTEKAELPARLSLP